MAACQIEYSDSLIEVIRKWGYHQEKWVGNFASLAECERVRHDAVRQSGDPSLANNMRCVGCSNPAPSGSSGQQSSSSSSSHEREAAEAAQRAAQEKERQDAFNREHDRLLQMLKGEGGSSSGLKLKSSGDRQAALQLKDGSSASLPLHRPTQKDDEARRIAAAETRMAELKQRITGIQSLLRQYSKSLANNSAEFDKWGETVDSSYNSVLSNSKEYVLGLFLEYNLLGNLKKIRKESFDELARLARSTDPKLRGWLRKELRRRRVGMDRFEKLVKLGQGEGDFAGVLSSEEGMRKNLDAVILINDLMGIAGKGLPDGGAFQHAKMIGETYADLASISYSWFSINRLDRDTEKLGREVDSLSFRMRQAQKEMDCIKACSATSGEKCVQRCSGKTRFSTPPPPLP